MKPNGISLSLEDSGVRLSVSVPSKVEDAIWDAVEMAIENGWSPQKFKFEAAEAWEVTLRDQAKDAVRVLSK